MPNQRVVDHKLPRRQPPPPVPTDIRQTKQYKTAARRWTSTIVALPILMYTSWILYERVYGEKKVKHLGQRQAQDQGQSEGSS